jgi:triphosphoribosyl-dephospho-CoA synthase
VDREDSGSHPDLTFALMARSVAFARDHLLVLARSLDRREPLAAQVALARVAERRMHAHFGTNTHRGALFLGGVLLAARARAPEGAEGEVRAAVAGVARELLPALAPEGTHGAAARARFGVGGILQEVGAGLPSVFDVALPAYRGAVARGEAGEAPSFRVLAALMRSVEDTTALHRCGVAGLAILRDDGAELERRLDAGDPAPFLRERNAAYRALNLTMGGVADLLGLAHGWLAACGELVPERGEGSLIGAGRAARGAPPAHPPRRTSLPASSGHRSPAT